MAKSKAQKGTKPPSATSGTSAGPSGSAITNTTDHGSNSSGGSSTTLTNEERKTKGCVQSGKLDSAQRGIEEMDLDEQESASKGSRPCIIHLVPH